MVRDVRQAHEAMLIGNLLERALRTTPDVTAATLCGGRRSFAELDAEADALAAGLRACGVGSGELVVWWTKPCLATLAGMLAAGRIGAVFTPMNPHLSGTEACEILDFLGPAAIVVDEAHHPVATAWSASAIPVTIPDELARASAAASEGPPPGEDDPHIAYLTSGSTGRPKAVLVSHRASWLRAAPGGGTFATTVRGNGGIVCTFPLYHYGGWHYVMEAWLNMTAIHLVPRADAASIVELVQRWRPSALYCIPAVWERLLDQEHAGADLSSLQHCDTGTSPVTTELVARIKQRIPGSTTSVLYGSTEAGRMAALADWELDDRPGSVGRPAFPCSLWVDAAGEVCVRTPAMMSGYLHDPEATGQVLDGGVYRSGDLGVLDHDGYLRLTGRTKEMIRTGGEFVAPVEVERALASHPAVADVAVVGLPDEHWGERVCAVVVAAHGSEPDLESLCAHLAGRLAPHKRPRSLELAYDIPRTPATGQIQRSLVRRWLLDEQRQHAWSGGRITARSRS